jgi:hypothetical protein
MKLSDSIPYLISTNYKFIIHQHGRKFEFLLTFGESRLCKRFMGYTSSSSMALRKLGFIITDCQRL